MSTRATYRNLATLGGLLALLITRPAAAQEAPSEAAVHQTQGEAYFAADNFDAALVEFERVYELLEGNPSRYVVRFNIGQCEERLFRYDDALRSYQAYLDEGGPDAEDRATIEATIRALDGMLGTLTIETNVESAEIWVDDRMLGTAPGSIRVPPGNHSVEVRASQFSPGRQEVQLATHASRTLTFTLEPLGTSSGLHPAFFGTGVGLTAVALGIGIAYGVSALTTHDSVAAAAGGSDPAQWGSVWDGDRHHIADLALTADVFYGVAGALAVGSLVLLFLTDWSGGSSTAAPDASATAWMLVPSVTPSGAALHAIGVF